MTCCILRGQMHSHNKWTKRFFIIRWKSLFIKEMKKSSLCARKRLRKRLKTANSHLIYIPGSRERHNSAETLNNSLKISVDSLIMSAKRTAKCLKRGNRLRLHRSKLVLLSALAPDKYSCKGSKGLNHVRPKKMGHILWRAAVYKMQLEGFIIRRIPHMVLLV
jgi:hypothetical protein